MNLSRGTCIVLAVTMVLLLPNSSASIYNVSCLNKANYQATAIIGSGSTTCDVWYQYQSGSGQMLATVNWATVTPAFIAGLPDVNGQTMIQQFDLWSTFCCVRIIFERCCVFWTNFLILLLHTV